MKIEQNSVHVVERKLISNDGVHRITDVTYSDGTTIRCIDNLAAERELLQHLATRVG